MSDKPSLNANTTTFYSGTWEKFSEVSYLLPYLSNGVNNQRIIISIERDNVYKPFRIWLGTEEALNKNAGSLPFLYVKEFFSFKEKRLPIMASRIGLHLLKMEH